jgi:hypothetical protein
MRHVEHRVHKVTGVPRYALDELLHVAELVDVEDDTCGVTTEKHDNDAQQHHTQVNFFALPSR